MSDESDASAFDPAPFDPERFEAGMPPRPSERRPGLALLPVLALLAVLFVVPVPYFLVTPGPAEDVIPLIHISGHQTYPTEGHLLLTTVGFDTANAYQALWALVAPNRELFKESDFLAPGESTQQQQQRSLSDMDTSKIDAAIVALICKCAAWRNPSGGCESI